MNGATVVKLTPPEKSGVVVGYTHRLGRILLAPGTPNPIGLQVGRVALAMTADEANSLAMALAKAAADSGRVL